MVVTPSPDGNDTQVHHGPVAGLRVTVQGGHDQRLRSKPGKRGRGHALEIVGVDWLVGSYWLVG